MKIRTSSASLASVLGCILGAAILPSLPSTGSAQANVARATVRIDATSSIAEESSYPFRRIAFVGEFTVSRSGPTNHSLPVFLQYSGSATYGVDYPNLPWLVSIPAGATSAVVRVEAKPDELAEPIETLVATVSNCPPDREPRLLVPCYDFDIVPAHGTATVFLRDDGITEASIDITRPHNGQTFKLGQTILIEAVAIDLNSYISRVEFYDGDHRVGESEIFFFVAPDPGTPIHHSFEWRGATVGSHQLTARTRLLDGTGVSSRPVRISVETDLPLPAVVRIDATRPVAEEDASPLERLPLIGEFTISRTSPTETSLPVFLHVSGTAVPGKDYHALPFLVSIPAGAASVSVRVQAIPDDEPEGVETLVATLSNCPPDMNPALGIPCYLFEIDPEHASATVLIRDNPFDNNRPPAVAIVRPTSGARFPIDTAIAIVAEARDPDGYTRKAEFFANGRKIGEQTLEFLVPPPPGETQTFDFNWRHPEPGAHRLVVRVTDNRGAAGLSAPVEITVAPDEALPVVTVVARDCFASEPTTASAVNSAAFLVRRHGPTNAALTVAYSMSGTAHNGIDYERLTGTVTIPAGSRSALVTVRPLADNVQEGIETVIIQLAPPVHNTANGRYLVGNPARALAIISDHPWARFLDAGPCHRPHPKCAVVAFAAEAGFNYRVEATDDLRRWETICVLPAIDAAVIFADEDADRGHRFYRISPEPVANDE